MLGHYDRWKLADGDDPGRGRVRKTPTMCCRDCAWRGTFTQSVEHFRETDHRLTYRGYVQNFEKYR